MWRIREHREIEKTCRKLPEPIVRKYELWKDIVARHGPDKLREFPALHDEKLSGDRTGQRSSRLSLSYRVIYAVEKDVVTVLVLDINKHNY